MKGFAEVYAALQAGKQVRRKHWDRGSVMFVDGSKLMYSCRGTEPSEASGDTLDWRDMNAGDWIILPNGKDQRAVRPTSTRRLNRIQPCTV